MLIKKFLFELVKIKNNVSVVLNSLLIFNLTTKKMAKLKGKLRKIYLFRKKYFKREINKFEFKSPKKFYN